MRSILGGAPVGDVTRTEFYDDRGEPYYVIWDASPPVITTSRQIPSSNVPGPGRAPVGNVCRTVFYDADGEIYYTEWKVCQPTEFVGDDGSGVETVIDFERTTELLAAALATG